MLVNGHPQPLPVTYHPKPIPPPSPLPSPLPFAMLNIPLATM